jgi:hypothetical protein
LSGKRAKRERREAKEGRRGKLDTPSARIEPYRCPRCNYLNDAAWLPGKEPKQPKPGDFLICVGCAAVVVYVSSGGDYSVVRATTAAENYQLVTKEDWMIMLAAAQRGVREH